MDWYEEDIKRLESKPLPPDNQPYTIFFGSSTIRLWTGLEKDLAFLNPVNLGFGGSTLAACAYFFDRVMARYKPAKLVVYAGDNDLGDGRHPEEVFVFFQQLAARVNKKYGQLPCYYISLKPSINRWRLVEQFKYANSLIANEIATNLPNWHWIDIFGPMLNDNGTPEPSIFLEDGLHLSLKGYQLWTKIIESQPGMHS